MHEMKIFENPEFGQVRIIEQDGEPWFVGKDVADVLKYQNGSRDINRHVDEEDRCKVMLFDGNQNKETILINESGLYSLILSSKLDSAKRFKRWVTSEILPAVRKHGAYMTEETLEQALMSPDFLIKLATELKKEKDRNLLLEAEKSKLTVENAIMQPKASYFDELVDRNLLTGIRETAKELKIKERNFVNFLIEKKYLYRDQKGKLQPFAERNNGLFELKESMNEKTGWTGTQLLITPKGRETFRLLCLQGGLNDDGNAKGNGAIARHERADAEKV